jgi:hypothetical protein
MKYDIIGDIHGHADELVLLLSKLDYKKNVDGVFEHESRQAIFVGDLIDRGPKIRETLQIVKGMVDAGKALCVRGNHEDNAINFWKKDDKGEYRRKHTIKNIVQHFATIKAFQNREDEWTDYLKWFETLPYFLNLPSLRVVHACWPSALTKVLQNGKQIILQNVNNRKQIILQNVNNRKQIILKDNENDPEFSSELINTILRGAELPMPEGIHYADKDGNVRTASRTKWWLDTKGLTYRQYFEAYVQEIPGLDVLIPETELGSGYSPDEVPVFFGHYWLRGEPIAQTKNVCCLDYSVAKGGSLVAYRFDGERIIDNSKFVTVVASY